MDRESGSSTDDISSTVIKGEIPNSRSATSKLSRVFSSTADSSSESKSLGGGDRKSAQTTEEVTISCLKESTRDAAT